jgi:DNA polymerase
VFNIPISEVTKQQRTFCKPPELGCGYYLGGPGLVAYAQGMGVTMNEAQATSIVRVWRNANPKVVAMWKWLQQACLHTIEFYGVHTGYGVTISRTEKFLTIELPSGRKMYYFEPEVQTSETRKRKQMTYMGRDDKQGGGWHRVWTHPGKITENIIQACARDVLREGLLNIDAMTPFDDGFIVGHVHDEPVLEVPEALGDEYLQACIAEMSKTPSWLPGCLLAADGAITKRYKKL